MFQTLGKIWAFLSRLALIVTMIDELTEEVRCFWEWLKNGDEEPEPDKKK